MVTPAGSGGLPKEGAAGIAFSRGASDFSGSKVFAGAAAVVAGLSFQKAAAGCGALLSDAGTAGLSADGDAIGGPDGLPNALLDVDVGGVVGLPNGLVDVDVDELLPFPLAGAAEAAAG
jgi:hypothetical protein